jgi:hypothetical protein
MVLWGKPGKGNSCPAPRWLSCDGRGVRLLNGAPVEPDADGCCVGLKGAGDTFALCMTEPTTSGLIAIPESGEFAWSFTCDRHAAVLDSPRPLTSDDVQELNRRRRRAIAEGP